MAKSRRRKARNQRQASRPNYRKQQRVAAQAPPKAVPVALSASRVASLDPLAPIIVRSGRPFDDQSGPDPARFPPPSTVAGCIRTAWARQTGRPFSSELAELAVQGPLLVRDCEVLVPKPADALYFGSGADSRCVRAEPRDFDEDAGSDLPGGLLPVRLTEPEKAKPGQGSSWWNIRDLLAFRKGTQLTHSHLTKNGWSPPAGERRTHVAIGSSGVAEPGKLFQTVGLDFTDVSKSKDEAPLSGVRSLRLLVRCGEDLEQAAVHLGGERRLAALRPEPTDLWPTAPDGSAEAMQREGGICLTLLTPGFFSAGFRPGWLDDTLAGSPPGSPNLRLRLRSVAVGRWQPNSGWDLAQQCPRPTRKLAPAGTTYWFGIVGDAPAEELAKLWLAPVSDNEQARRDGFGLALPSPWQPPD